MQEIPAKPRPATQSAPDPSRPQDEVTVESFHKLLDDEDVDEAFEDFIVPAKPKASPG
jgi:hypothetical protein